MQATALAHTNIALIKYWGKRHDALILPTNNSLSITLDGFYTTTSVTFQDDLKQDEFYLNDQWITGVPYKRVKTFLDVVRAYAQRQLSAHVDSFNKVPTAAGIASSAFSVAALAASATRALDLNRGHEELSSL